MTEGEAAERRAQLRANDDAVLRAELDLILLPERGER